MDVKQLGNEPAQARPYSIDTWGDGPKEVPAQIGLTKRETFAMVAMQGMLASPEPGSDTYVAKFAVKHADALLAELAKDQQ